MIEAKDFIQEAKKAGFRLYTGVPCSYLKPFINAVIDSSDLDYIGAANEGDAVGIAAGADLAGKRAVVMFQNSGFGNAVNPLSSLNAIFEIPALIITTLRGEPGGPADEPQHQLMGQITAEMFDTLRIPHETFPTEVQQIPKMLERVTAHFAHEKKPYGLIMKKGTVAPRKLASRPTRKSISVTLPPHQWSADPPNRKDTLAVVQKTANKRDVLVATTGFTGRALYAVEDRPNQLYMVGSMGCAPTVGLGIAWAQPSRRVFVLDGDGALLMRLGALATVGFERPKNLVHILLDNEIHDSTGGQSTVSHSVDLAAVAAACGYPQVHRCETLPELENTLTSVLPSNELSFFHIKTKKGDDRDLPRPTVRPSEVAERLREFLAQ